MGNRPHAMHQSSLSGGRGRADQLGHPVVGTARHGRHSGEHRGAYTQRQHPGRAWPIFWLQPLEKVLGIRNDKIEQSRRRCRPPRSDPRGLRQQQTPHQSGVGGTTGGGGAPPGRSIHDLLTLSCAAFNPHQESVRWVRPEQPRVEPEVLERPSADRAREPPALHPAPQPRAAGKGICRVPTCAGPANLCWLPDRHQPAAHSAAARLRHVTHQVRRAAQNVGKQRRMAARKAQVEVAHRRDLDGIVPQQAPTTHAEEGSVPVKP